MASLTRQNGCCFLIDQIGATGIDAPVLAVGQVVITATGNREPTQDPMTGFACGDTPLGRGHIIALFLGGPDIAQNYAPQYEQWQQGGAWKNMELGVRAAALTMGPGDALYMVVQLTYGRTGNNYLAEQQLFAAGHIHDWDERRIPSRFDVWTFRANATGAAAVLSLLGGPDGPAIGALQQITTKPFLTPVQSFDVSQMPDEDYAFWLRNRIRAWARARSVKALADYRADYKTSETNLLISNVVTAKSKTTSKGISKPKIAKHTASLGKLSRAQTTSLDIKLRVQHGFNAHLSTDAWMLGNLDKVVAHIREELGKDPHGVRIADSNVLNSAAAAQFVAQQLT